MALSSIDVNLKEGDARPLAAGPTKALIIAPASGGTKATTIYTFANVRDIAATIGDGPATVAAGIVLQLAPAGYKGVDVIVSNGSITATSGSYTQSGVSAVLTGTPYDTYDFRLEITKGGALGTAKFSYTLDGGNTYSTGNIVPTTGAFSIPRTGLTLTFSSTQTLGGTASFVTVGPDMNTSDLNACMETYRVANRAPTLILLGNSCNSPASSSLLFSQLSTGLTTMDETNGVYTQGVLSCGGEAFLYNRTTPTSGSVNAQNVLQHTTGSTSLQMISTFAEKVNAIVADPFAGFSVPRVPTSWLFGAEAHAVGADISKNPAKDPLRGASTPSYDEFQNGEIYSEFKIGCPRTYPGEPGIFIDQSHLKTANGSSFNIWPKGRLANEARRVTSIAIRPWLHERIRTLTDGTGRIDPRDKQIIEDEVNALLRAALITPSNGRGFNGHCTACVFSLNAENDVLTTNVLQGSVLMVPFAYPTAITIDVSFTRSVAIAPTE